jgi:ABC transporter substrate binding protein
MAYAPSYPDMFQRAAIYVDKILKGAKPGDLPVEQPKRYEFVINLKAAQAIDLTIPPLLLFQADEVIRRPARCRHTPDPHLDLARRVSYREPIWQPTNTNQPPSMTSPR